jgi:diaminohydroxyphosphoribosylaminopyrimidine deaminase/5-amino-6-(5-phosphoribosylamino)uracil reductase
VTPEDFMRLALVEAEKGRGRTHPNPAVGALVVRNGRLLSRGHHEKAGLPHAEVNALRKADARSADLYVTLEPCNHHGRTPPCTEAIIAAGVKRVFYGSEDPNPLVDGHGARRLRKAGVQVIAGVLREECGASNEPWFKFITRGIPWVVLKAAVTLDGKLATRTGDSKWISGDRARALVHRWRDQFDAVLVGAGTVRADDPRLTARFKGARNPLRVVLGTPPPRAQILREKGETLVAHGSLKRVLQMLAGRGLTSVLVEGGAAVHGRFLEERLWDEVRLFIGPKITGASGLSWAGFEGPAKMRDALKARIISTAEIGDDILVIARPLR